MFLTMLETQLRAGARHRRPAVLVSAESAEEPLRPLVFDEADHEPATKWWNESWYFDSPTRRGPGAAGSGRSVSQRRARLDQRAAVRSGPADGGASNDFHAAVPEDPNCPYPPASP